MTVTATICVAFGSGYGGMGRSMSGKKECYKYVPFRRGIHWSINQHDPVCDRVDSPVSLRRREREKRGGEKQIEKKRE